MNVLLSKFEAPGADRKIAPHDGYWWTDGSGEQKALYVQGYVGGISVVLERLACFTMPDSLYAKSIANADYKYYWTTNYAYSTIYSECELYELKVGQLTKGLDEFYQDYRNMTILLDDAIQIVKLEIRGETREIIEEHKRWQRVRASRGTMSDSVYFERQFEHWYILDSLGRR